MHFLAASSRSDHVTCVPGISSSVGWGNSPSGEGTIQTRNWESPLGVFAYPLEIVSS